MNAGSSLKFWSGRLLLIACIGLVPAVAAAEDAAVSPARALFNEGRALASDGNYKAACPKFEQSLRLEVGVGVQFNLADCWERTGRIASAQALFLGAAASAKAAGQTDREQVLRDRAAALEPRLSRMVIETAETDPKLVVKRDDMPLEPDSLGKATALDPGTYTILARAPGKKPWTKQVELLPETKVLTVEVPALESDAPPVVAVAAVPAKKEPEPAPAQPAQDRGSAMPTTKVWVIGGIGVAGLAVGTIYGVKYKNANGDAEAICPTGKGCSVQEIQEHDALIDKAKNARTWSYVGFGVGAAAVAGAVVLYIVDRKAAAKHASLTVLPTVGERGELGAGVLGTF